MVMLILPLIFMCQFSSCPHSPSTSHSVPQTNIPRVFPQLVLSSESRPGTQSPSVYLSTTYPVPDSVRHQIPPDVLSNWEVTITFWLKPAMPSNG